MIVAEEIIAFMPDRMQKVGVWEGMEIIEVEFYDSAADVLLKFAFIITNNNGKWVFFKHRERGTYEVPGAHREMGETILETAERELQEETGAIDYAIKPICVYSVKGKAGGREESFGMLFFAEVHSFGEIHSEIENIIICDDLIDNWTYPQIQPKLLQEAKRRRFV